MNDYTTSHFDVQYHISLSTFTRVMCCARSTVSILCPCELLFCVLWTLSIFGLCPSSVYLCCPSCSSCCPAALATGSPISMCDYSENFFFRKLITYLLYLVPCVVLSLLCGSSELNLHRRDKTKRVDSLDPPQTCTSLDPHRRDKTTQGTRWSRYFINFRKKNFTVITHRDWAAFALASCLTVILCSTVSCQTDSRSVQSLPLPVPFFWTNVASNC